MVWSELGRTRNEPETIATMPGRFQILPHPDRTWMLDIDGRRIDMDLFDASVWRRHRWSVWDPQVRRRVRAAATDDTAAEPYLAALEAYFASQLTRAARFHRALSRRVAAAPTQYIVFGSACFPTTACWLLQRRLRRADCVAPGCGRTSIA